MSPIDQNSYLAVQPELATGESILGAGQPNRRVTFHKQDVFLIPFSLMWGGFAIFWEAGVLGFWGSSGHRTAGPWIFGMIWGNPFVVIGQYLIWGRFVYAAWKKKRIHYAVTNRRVMLVQTGTSRRTASAYLDALPTLIKEGGSNGIGALRFVESVPSGRNASWDGLAIGTVPIFVDIEDVDSVYHLVSDLREKSRSAKAASV